tara:strand:+ start:3814 stop:4248 length:435 start_codon:yes stop_codon:yes gene_type:complete
MSNIFQGKRLEWSEENLQFAIESIKKNLTRELVPPGWRNANSRNPMGGHCHNATGALYMLFGPEYLQLWQGNSPGPNGNALHFWVTVKGSDRLIDITVDQYGEEGYDYSIGHRSTMLGHSPYYNAKEVYERVLRDFYGESLNLF